MSDGRGGTTIVMGFFFLLRAITLFAQEPSPFETAQPGYHYQFPRDNFSHLAYQTEWWYYTGNVIATDGHYFGFELTFFQPGANRDSANDKAWDVQDLYLAHAALSDIDGGYFYHAERLN